MGWQKYSNQKVPQSVSERRGEERVGLDAFGVFVPVLVMWQWVLQKGPHPHRRVGIREMCGSDASGML